MEKLPITLYPKKSKKILNLIICLALVVLGISIIDKNFWAGMLNIIMFGIGTIMFAVNLHPQASYLKIDEKGLEMRTLFRSTMIPWHVIHGFTTKKVLFKNMVTFNFNVQYIDLSKMKNRTPALPDTYGMSAKELAKKLNDIKKQFSYS